MPEGQYHYEIGALSINGFRVDGAAVVLHHFSAQCQSDACTFKPAPVVQALEQRKYFFFVFLFETDTVIGEVQFNKPVL